jgi:hypothetical protein
LNKNKVGPIHQQELFDTGPKLLKALMWAALAETKKSTEEAKRVEDSDEMLELLVLGLCSLW